MKLLPTPPLPSMLKNYRETQATLNMKINSGVSTSAFSLDQDLAFAMNPSVLPLLHLGTYCGFNRRSVHGTSLVLSQSKPPEMYIVFIISGPTLLIHSCRATLLANLANSDSHF